MGCENDSSSCGQLSAPGDLSRGERVGSFASPPKMRAVREGRDVLGEHVPDQLRGEIILLVRNGLNRNVGHKFP